MEQYLNLSAIKLENTYATLPEAFYTKQYPSKVPSPKLVIWNNLLGEELGENLDFLKQKQGIEILAGNRIVEGTTPIAQAYAGHQFGHFTMLGDGRAVLLGEYVTGKGERFDIQLKGSGRTPYSRGGDGKAALGPMLREYIISEAMNALGIPTTRSLAVLMTGEGVVREAVLPGAILVRIAKSHIRVGTFEYANQFRNKEELKALADYTWNRHFKENQEQEQPYVSLLQEVVKRQAKLIAQWQLVGFIHGVMNTDNMAISGETIDYGPCAFMNRYDPDTVFSSIDMSGRYSYQNQPKMASWDLARFAESLLPLLADTGEEAIKIVQEEIDKFPEIYHAFWLEGMREKLGLFHLVDGDNALIEELLRIMFECHADYTNTFRDLTLGVKSSSQFADSEAFEQWYQLWQKRRENQQESLEESKALMESKNPTVIPRNESVEDALKQAVENQDYSAVESLVSLLRNPFDYSNREVFYEMPSDFSDCGYKTYCGT
ncbi:protein adenylyltransferase SelO [Anaerosporobacter sp.]|uniref:protein adenylyltransferase SelO n=1 Tax=Anaerosporobacter sp. TaxID=1872529 RepID=UPI00286EF74E|nr:YdiU family protein [Anaerosporobacter sp.]